MNISGIRPTAGFYSYNSIKINELRNQQLAVTTQEKAAKRESVIEQEEVPVEQTLVVLILHRHINRMQHMSLREKTVMCQYLMLRRPCLI